MNMSLFKRAHVRGMAHQLSREGITLWPSKQAEEEVADAVADDLGDEEIPEMTDETGLTPEQASAVVQKLVEVADEIAQKTGSYDPGVNKTAASMDYESAATSSVVSLMQKVAAETGPDVPGTGAPSPAEGATAETAIDAQKVPSADRVGPQGTTDFSTAGGEVGKEEKRPDQPGTETSGSTAKLSAMFKHMAAMDGASLTGGDTKGPAPTPRKDLEDNQVIPGAVASSRGATGFAIPEAARVGATKAQPAGTPGTTAPTPNDVATDARKTAAFLVQTPEGRALIRKLAEEACEHEKKEETKEEDKKEEKKDENKPDFLLPASEKKEAQISAAIQNLLAAVR
jgi:hypothetical protein